MEYLKQENVGFFVFFLCFFLVKMAKKSVGFIHNNQPECRR